jgi:hypothetical protein
MHVIFRKTDYFFDLVLFRTFVCFFALFDVLLISISKFCTKGFRKRDWNLISNLFQFSGFDLWDVRHAYSKHN